jgi:hypothetical protein
VVLQEAWEVEERPLGVMLGTGAMAAELELVMALREDMEAEEVVDMEAEEVLMEAVGADLLIPTLVARVALEAEEVVVVLQVVPVAVADLVVVVAVA